MAWTYDCDYELQAYRLTPTSKRQDVYLSMLYCMVSPLQWQQGIFFDKYLNGDSSSAYNGATSYVRGDRVNYQNRIYECTNDSTGNLPTDRGYWYQILGDFRGVTERIKYNCQKLMIEWVLNKWFATTFRQPSAGNSDIYITDNSRFVETFVAVQDSFIDGVYVASGVYEQASKVKKWVKATPSYTATTSNFTVYYPVATIPSTTNDLYYQLVDLVNKYKVYGSTVDYVSY